MPRSCASCARGIRTSMCITQMNANIKTIYCLLFSGSHALRGNCGACDRYAFPRGAWERETIYCLLLLACICVMHMDVRMPRAHDAQERRICGLNIFSSTDSCSYPFSATTGFRFAARRAGNKPNTRPDISAIARAAHKAQAGAVNGKTGK